MAWADVPQKLTQWMLEPYYMTDGIDRLNAEFNVSSVDDVPVESRVAYEARLDYYIGACNNLEASRAIDPKLLRGA